MAQRIDPQAHVARISIESFTRALERNVKGSEAEELKRVAFNVVFDSGELTIAGVREEGLLCQGAARSARQLEALLTDWLARGEVQRDSAFDRTPIDAQELLAQIGRRSPESVARAQTIVELLDPLQTGQIKFADLKQLRADVIRSQRDFDDPVAKTTGLMRAFLMTASAGELSRLLPQIHPGAQRFTQPFEPLT
jgi:hypothetical protein